MAYEANGAIEQWLAQEVEEEVLEPELPIVDPHHHLWDLRPAGSSNLFEQKVYLCQHIADDINSSGHNVVQTVFAQCGAMYRADGPEELRCIGETEFVQGIVAMSNAGIYGGARLCTGIFGSADLNLGAAVEPVLLAHLAASSNFRGIRSAFPTDFEGSDFAQGYAMLAKHNLAFDNYSPDYERLPTLAKLAATQPTVPVIVNHLGGKIDPHMDADEFARWKSCIDAVAAVPNCVLKCGGAQQRVGPDWEPPFHMHRRQAPIGSSELCDLLFKFYSYAIDAFGADRCMFESNFPVDKECVSYRTLWNFFKRIAAKKGLSDEEKASVFSGTACRVYRLPPVATVAPKL